jgi:uncharacterized protein (TIGR02145 family)
MKQLYTLLVFIITLTVSAQAPQGFNYQATVRNSSGDLIVNQNVYFKFNVMLNSATSVPVYSETHYVPTDDLGAVNLVIGQGTATTGTISDINWGTGNYYLGIELNTGASYVAMGTTQLLSVPYALYANSSGNINAETPDLAAVLAVNNGANNLQIKNLADPTDDQDAVTKIYLETQIVTLQTQITALQNAIPAPLTSVTIGTQVWQLKNLDVPTYSDGTPIPQVTDQATWEALKTGAWCYYNNDSANGTTYGKMYNWYAVKGITVAEDVTPTEAQIASRKQLAPTGWHVSSNDEWTVLTTFLGGISIAGSEMKEIGTTHWTNLNTDATNSSGFTALPGGYRASSGPFGNIGTFGYWWSSTEIDAANSWSHLLGYNRGRVESYNDGKWIGLSVRCVRD